MWQHMEVTVSGACSKQGQTRAFRAFFTQVLKTFRTAQTFWATYSNTSLSLQWKKVSYFQFKVQISMLTLYVDLNLLFSLNYHHTVCLSLPGAFTVVLQHCLSFYTTEQQKSSTITELRGTSQSLLISQLPKKWGFWRNCRTKHALFSFCSSNGNFYFAVLWLAGLKSFCLPFRISCSLSIGHCNVKWTRGNFFKEMLPAALMHYTSPSLKRQGICKP